MTNLEAERIRSRVESMGGCVKLKTVTEIRQCSTRDTFIEECLSCTEFFFGLEARGEIETAKCAVKENAEAFYRVGERDCGIIKLKGVERNL